MVAQSESRNRISYQKQADPTPVFCDGRTIDNHYHDTLSHTVIYLSHTILTISHALHNTPVFCVGHTMHVITRQFSVMVAQSESCCSLAIKKHVDPTPVFCVGRTIDKKHYHDRLSHSVIHLSHTILIIARQFITRQLL